MLFVLMIGCSVSDERYCETVKKCYEGYVPEEDWLEECLQLPSETCEHPYESTSIKKETCENRWELYKQCASSFPDEVLEDTEGYEIQGTAFMSPCQEALFCCSYSLGFKEYNRNQEERCQEFSPEMMEKYKDYKPQPPEE
jgi:hypothetical protein